MSSLVSTRLQTLIANVIGLLQFVVFVYSHRPVYRPAAPSTIKGWQQRVMGSDNDFMMAN